MIGVGATLFKVPTAYGPAPFSPASLFSNGEEGAWYDISDLTTLFEEDGTTPASVDGVVGKVLDKSGNGNHLVQTTSTKCPILRKTAGDLYYLEFDGVDDGLETASNIPFGTGSVAVMSVFSAAKKSSAATNQNVLELSDNIGTSNGGFRLFCTSADQWRAIQKGTTANVLTSSAVGNPNLAVLSSVASITAPSHLFRKDGSEVASNTASLGTGTYLDHPLNMGARNNGTSSLLDGEVYGAIVVGKVCDSSEISDVENYLGRKSGVTI